MDHYTKKNARLLLNVLSAFLLLAACALPASAESGVRSVYESYKIAPDSVRMTAHRGFSAIAPENTLPAFRLAGEYGFWGAECDTSPTADGVWIIMHDDTVDRMTNGEGRVKDLTYEELRALTIDDGSNVDSFPGTKVPTLTEYLDVCGEYGVHPVIEIKTCADVADLDSLAALLSAREDREMFTIITFGAEHAARIKALMPQTPVFLLVGGDLSSDFDGAVRFCLDNGLDGIDFCWNWDEEHVKAVQAAGLKTMVWTVDDPDLAARHYEWGVRDITTNCLTQGQELPLPLRFERKVHEITDTRFPFFAPVSWADFSFSLYCTALSCGLALLLLALATAVTAAGKKRGLTGALAFLCALIAAVSGTYASRLFVLWDNLPLYACVDALFLLSVSGVVMAALCAKNGFALPKGKRMAGAAVLSLFLAAAPYEIAVLVINTLIFHGLRPTFSVTLSAFVPMAVVLGALLVILASARGKAKQTENSPEEPRAGQDTNQNRFAPEPEKISDADR